MAAGKVQFNIRIEQSTYEAFKQAAKDADLSLAQWVARACKEKAGLPVDMEIPTTSSAVLAAVTSTTNTSTSQLTTSIEPELLARIVRLEEQLASVTSNDPITELVQSKLAAALDEVKPILAGDSSPYPEETLALLVESRLPMLVQSQLQVLVDDKLQVLVGTSLGELTA